MVAAKEKIKIKQQMLNKLLQEGNENEPQTQQQLQNLLRDSRQLSVRDLQDQNSNFNSPPITPLLKQGSSTISTPK